MYNDKLYFSLRVLFLCIYKKILFSPDKSVIIELTNLATYTYYTAWAGKSFAQNEYEYEYVVISEIAMAE